jgi:solute carrier family 25 S-adenosylmethionine transporter 26
MIHVMILISSDNTCHDSQEYLKLAWLRDGEKTALEPWQSVVSGAAAGALSASLTTPLDVVKTRLMTQARKTVSSSGLSEVRAEAAARAQTIAAYTYTGVASTLQQIWVEEGVLGLTKGMGPRLFYSACFSALGFFAFETTRVIILRKYLERKAAAENAEIRIL